MPAYNFQKQFARAIKAGFKKHTIRPKRKRPTRIGDKLYLYTGMRTKACEKLLETTCIDVIPVEIGKDYIILHDIKRSLKRSEELAKMDGFKTAQEFFDFFKEKYGAFPIKDMEMIVWE